MKKRVLCALLAAGMMTMALASCGGSGNGSENGSENSAAPSSSASENGADAGNDGGEASAAVDMEGDPYTVHFMFLNQTEENPTTIWSRRPMSWP